MLGNLNVGGVTIIIIVGKHALSTAGQNPDAPDPEGDCGD